MTFRFKKQQKVNNIPNASSSSSSFVPPPESEGGAAGVAGGAPSPNGVDVDDDEDDSDEDTDGNSAAGSVASPGVAFDYNFLSETEKREMAEVESFPAETYFEEFTELVFPSAHSRSGILDRCPVSHLRVGFLLPILNFKDDVPSFDTYLGVHAYYVVISVNDFGGSVDLSRVAEYRRNADGSVFASPAWLSFAPSFSSSSRTVIVVSHLVASTPQRLPFGVRQSLKDNFALTAKGPSSSTGLISSSLASIVESDKNRAAVLRELAAAPLLRALHNAYDRFARLVGPTKDVRDKSFLVSLRNRFNSSTVQSLPVTQSLEHLELFVTFKWSRELSMPNKKAECCHLQLFKPLDSSGNVTPFTDIKDIGDALQMLESACIDCFLDERDMGFYGQAFYTLHRRIASREINSCLSALPVNFLIYKVSQLLLDWAELFIHPDTRFLPRDRFLELNMQTLNFDPLAWRQEATNIPSDLLPKQFGLQLSAPNNKRNSNNKRRSSGRASSEAPPAKKSEGGVKGHSKKGHKTPSATTTGLGLPAYGFQPSAGTAGKYICVTDFVHKQRPSDFPSCRSGSDCSKRHIPKPASGQFAAKDKAEVLTV